LSEKLRFALEASDGLAYLEKKLCIHRDIAARNCLLGPKYEIKIADFGMSDDKVIVHDDTLEKVPVKWLAPETLQDKIYSLKTDVWSYGVLVWEIYADGQEPYPGLTRLQTRAKIVVQNYRMEMPKETPKSVAEVVYSCWEKDPARRPEMSQIHRTLKAISERTRVG
uniref:Protein kinase domain-containing protein n=2 Tax=Angiostrongylus cantonensis TaxID=6313 RepID=A0A0K0D2L1_ANGCA